MLKISFVILCCIAGCLSYRSCSNPTSYYNKAVTHPRAYSCNGKTSAQCVAALFKLCSAPYTGSWRKGTKVNSNCNSIPRYTAIASFSGSGGTRYNGNNGHAGVFLSCTSDGSIRIADQWCGHYFSERTLPKRCSSSKPYSNCADYFYTVEW
ncbi:hypothetical protein CHUAL_010800 [Chamberlinius hualienensis]